MIGMDAKTGKAIDGIAHLEQSIRDILTTPIGTRVMRRNYGSRLMYLIDRPLDQVLIADIRAAVAESLARYEPRLKLSKVIVQSVSEESSVDRCSSMPSGGRICISLEGYYLPTNQLITLSGITV